MAGYYNRKGGLKETEFVGVYVMEIEAYQKILTERLQYIVREHGVLENVILEEELLEIGESYVAALVQQAGIRQASEIFVAAVTGGIVAACHWSVIRENQETLTLYLCEAEVTDEALGIMQATDLNSESAKRYLILVSDLITEAVSMVGEYCEQPDAVEYIYATLKSLYQSGIHIGVNKQRLLS